MARGSLRHLGVIIGEDGNILHPPEIVPDKTKGKFSQRNVDGREIVRRDLAKETHYNIIESPNWGDASNGTHEVALPYEKYPRDFEAPRDIAIRIESHGNEDGSVTFRFTTSEPIDKNSITFDDELLFAINLLQENVGSMGIDAADREFEEFIREVHVAWEIFPPGTREEAVARVFRHRPPTPQERRTIEERYDFIMSLRPRQLVNGISGMQHYFGGLIYDDLVVFENVERGNAIYVMYEDWQELSQRSRTELLSGRLGNNFDRIVHAGGWRDKVRKLVRDKMAERE